jgi:hypothetical protein
MKNKVTFKSTMERIMNKQGPHTSYAISTQDLINVARSNFKYETLNREEYIPL